MNRTTEVVSAVLAEVDAATAKWPGWPTDPTHAIAILQEELGEATRAVCQATYEGKGGETLEDARQEIVQTAAMCLRWLANFDNYVIRPSERVVGDGGDVVTLDKPGDEYLTGPVVKRLDACPAWSDARGDGDADSPVTVEEMVAVFGQSGEAIRELVRQAAGMTNEQAVQVWKAWDAVPSDEWHKAWYAAQGAAREADRGDAWEEGPRAAWYAAEEAWYASRYAAQGAAGALVVCDLVGQHGLTQKHIATLLGPWAGAMGYPQGVTA